MEDIANILAYEIKADLAKRYFGCRKQLENDSSDYLTALLDLSTQGKHNISSTLAKICSLLSARDIYLSFLHFTRLPEVFFCTPSDIAQITQPQNLIAEFHPWGMTRKRKYTKTVHLLYSQLEKDVLHYCDDFSKVQNHYDCICSDLKSFYKNYDLSTTLQFLKEIDDPDKGRATLLNNQPNTDRNNCIDAKLQIPRPSPPAPTMPPLHPITPIKEATGQLNSYIQRGYAVFYKQRK